MLSRPPPIFFEGSGDDTKATTSPARDLAQLASAGSTAGWRSHTFGDGVRSLTLLGPLDVALAGRLWTRISELLERGCRKLIVDASDEEWRHARDVWVAAWAAQTTRGPCRPRPGRR
jgi:hypothetical protein